VAAWSTLIDAGKLLIVRKRLYPLYRLMLMISLRGIGVLNYENDRLSGEDYFLTHALKSYSEPVVLDVGANVGRYAGKVKQLYPRAIVYAFEPHPEAFRRLQLEATRHGYTAVNMGCDDQAGWLKLYDRTGTSGSEHASVYQDVIEDLHGSRSTAFDAEMTTVDAFVEARKLRKVHLLKIDTEGNEFKVLQGARRAIEAERIDLIQFEFGAMNLVSRVYFRDFCRLLPGYTFHRMLPDGLVPLETYDPALCEIFAYQNIVAVHKKCPLRL